MVYNGMTMDKTPLEKERLKFQPRIPRLLQDLKALVGVERASQKQALGELKALFPHTHAQKAIQFERGSSSKKREALRVGVVLSGGQAAGGHNVIAALFDGLKQLDTDSSLFGFLNGPGGIVEGKYKEITNELLKDYRNTGGFDLIGSGRTKIETEEQLDSSRKTVEKLKLDGLVVIGGDDSNTNAAILAEYFSSKKCLTTVVGVPKTIDGDLKSDDVEISFGFDTACKTYAELIGNIERDALSAKKYYHFIKLMGRSASHIALECALQTHPNYTLISEEKKTLHQITSEIADLIEARASSRKNYGVILIPEGLVEFVPEIKQLMAEINRTSTDVVKALSHESAKIFSLLPEKLQQQLLLERDPHGNVQVSLIATEELLIYTVKQELKKRNFKGKFSPLSHFFGYEGRSAFPSNFDANYCYALGLTAALLVQNRLSGYMSVVSNLTSPVEESKVQGIPLVTMMSFEERKGKVRPVITKALVELSKEPFLHFAALRKSWEKEDRYIFPGPIQYYGPSHLSETIPLSLSLERLSKINK